MFPTRHFVDSFILWRLSTCKVFWIRPIIQLRPFQHPLSFLCFKFISQIFSLHFLLLSQSLKFKRHFKANGISLNSHSNFYDLNLKPSLNVLSSKVVNGPTSFNSFQYFIFNKVETKHGRHTCILMACWFRSSFISSWDRFLFAFVIRCAKFDATCCSSYNVNRIIVSNHKNLLNFLVNNWK